MLIAAMLQAQIVDAILAFLDVFLCIDILLNTSTYFWQLSERMKGWLGGFKNSGECRLKKLSQRGVRNILKSLHSEKIGFGVLFVFVRLKRVSLAS